MSIGRVSVLGLGLLIASGCASTVGRHLADADAPDFKVGDVVRVDISDLHPTQFRVGQAEVDEKAKKFEDMSSDKLEDYLKDHPCPVVIGPGGVPYITDEQHRANASEEAEDTHHAARELRKHGEPTMYMKVIADFSKLSASEFQKQMVARHYCYLGDRGVQRPFNELPARVDEMKDDPYRSLAGFLENTAWNEKKGVYFIQFQVALWLRGHLNMSDGAVSDALDDKDQRKSLLKKVGELLQSKEASSESWYLD